MRNLGILLGLCSLLSLALALSSPGQAGDKKEPAKDKKEGKEKDGKEKDGKEKDGKEKDGKEGRKGTAIGVVVKKDKNTIDVLADGDEAPRKYFPRWIGGAPDKGGGLEKATLKTFAELKIGSRVEVQWVYEERFRALTVKVLEAPKDKEKEKEKAK